MDTNTPNSPELNLPADLVSFLTAGKQLDYDPSSCEAGAVRLVPFEELKLERFPVETSSQEFRKDDPNAPGVNSYLVLGVNLTAECNDNYSPAGLLMWLPIERRYAAWDSDHCTIVVFSGQVTWGEIVASPVKYLEATIGGEGYDPPFEPLIPWLAHPYGEKQVYDPQPA